MPAMVSVDDQPRYRNRKGDIRHNILAACSFDMKFTYILAGWEGSAHDSRLLRSALTRVRDKLFVPTGISMYYFFYIFILWIRCLNIYIIFTNLVYRKVLPG